MRLCSSVLALFVAGIGPSQTYVVDAGGGPGVSFTSIAAAVAAVPDGSVLLVRAGTYVGFVADNRGLTVLADPGVVVQQMPGPIPQPTIVIQNTTATQSFVLRNLAITTVIACTSCAGPVLLDQIHSDSTGWPPSPAMLELTQCSQVMVTSSNFLGVGFSSAVRATSSQVVLVDSTCHPGYGIGVGIAVLGSRLQVVSTAVSATTGTLGSIAIIADAASDVRLLGSTTVAAVAGSGYAISGAPTVRRASTVTLTGIVQASSMVVVADESLSGTGGALGGSVSATLNGENGNIGLLVLGVTGPPLPVPGIADSWWLDPAISASVALAVLSGPVTATVPIPPTPALQGEVFGFQGLFLAPTGLSVSNPYRFAIW